MYAPAQIQVQMVKMVEIELESDVPADRRSDIPMKPRTNIGTCSVTWASRARALGGGGAGPLSAAEAEAEAEAAFSCCSSLASRIPVDAQLDRHPGERGKGEGGERTSDGRGGRDNPFALPPLLAYFTHH